MDTSRLDNFIYSAISDTEPVEHSGLAIAIVQDGKIIFEKGYGYRDRMRRLPVTSKTLFAIGSTSKAFNSMALKIAESRGLINLGNPVVSYLPEFKLSDERISAQATLIDLLAHRTGLPRHDALWYLSGFDRYELVKHLGCLSYQKAPKPFRGSFVYNNLLVAATGVALERVSGERWEDFVRENIFVPVGMEDSGFFAPDFSKDFARPYEFEHELPYKDYSNIAPAAAVISNIDDLAKWVLFHLNHGRTSRGAEVLSRTQMDSMYLPYNTVNMTQAYGLGWFVDRFEGMNLVEHAGDSDGYHAYVSFLPEKNLGIVAVSNQHVLKFPDAVVHRVYRHLLQLPSSDSEDPLPAALSGPGEDSVANGEPSSTATPSGVREFDHCGYGRITLFREGGDDFVQYGPNKWHAWRIPFFGYLFPIDAYGKRTWVPMKYSDGDSGFSLPLEPTSDAIFFKLRRD